MHTTFATIALVLVSVLASVVYADHHEGDKQYIELRYYQFKSAEAAAQADAYLVDALLPALNRAGSKTIGVFREAEEQDQPLRLVAIPHDSVAAFAALSEKLAADETYQSAAKEYLQLSKQDTPLVRIKSELLHSFDCWPQLKMADEVKVDSRIFELRIYESSTEHYGNLKVEMFNAGEVPIFLDCGIEPVFMGQAVVGDKMPNLTYMTVYKDQAAKDKAWGEFPGHPDWKTLSAMEKYKGTVSKIHKFNLVPVAGSQL